MLQNQLEKIMLNIFTVLLVSAAAGGKKYMQYLTIDNFHWSFANEQYWAVLFCDGSASDCASKYKLGFGNEAHIVVRKILR